MNPNKTPAWILQIMSEIDSLEFGQGFDHFTADTDMYFGTTLVHGVDAIKRFFVKIDEPLNIVHDVVECWTADGVLMLRGEATMAKKTDPDKMVTAPFMHIFYYDDPADVRIHTLRVTAGPLQTDAML